MKKFYSIFKIRISALVNFYKKIKMKIKIPIKKKIKHFSGAKVWVKIYHKFQRIIVRVGWARNNKDHIGRRNNTNSTLKRSLNYTTTATIFSGNIFHGIREEKFMVDG